MSAGSVTLRQARPEDRAAIVAIERASFTDAWPESSFLQLLAQHPPMLRVAVADGAIIGYWVGQRIGDEAELQNIAVHGEWRGRGVGRLLLADFLEAVDADGQTVVFLEVRASNAAAIALYQRFGFREIDRRKGYYRKPVEDAVVMARPSGPAPAPAVPPVRRGV